MNPLLVIPVYNHGKTLVGVVREALATGHPVLVVDDGSTDGGTDGLGELACQVLRLPENRGKGAAILAAAQYARTHGYGVIVTMDADGQHRPADASALLARARNCPGPAIIIGARQMTGEHVPKASLFGRDFSNFWIRLECGAELTDTQSGYRLYPVAELLALPLARSRYDFEVEVLVRSVWAGLPVYEVGIQEHYPPAGERVSHFHQFLDNWRLTRLHTSLVLRRLLPLGHNQVVKEPARPPRIVVKKPLQTLKNLCLENTSPFWLAVAVWLGIFLGALPLLACHTLVIIYVAYRLHLNQVAAVAASQFCMPPVVPVLCIEVGYFLRNGSFLVDLSWETWLLEAHLRLWDWLLGSLLVGPLLGLVGAWLTYQAARRMQLPGRRPGKSEGV